MKKIVMAFMLLCSIGSLQAQKSAIQSAIQSLKDNDIAKAKSQIDQATTNESTSGNAKAWLLKAVIYQAIGMSTQKDQMPTMNFILNDNPYVLSLTNAGELLSSAPDALFIATDAYSKSLSLDSKYNKDELNSLISNLVFSHFNNGVNEMNASKFQAAAKSFEAVCTVAAIDKGNFYKGVPQIDTLAANAKYYQGYSLNQAGDDKAIALLEESAKSPFINTSDVYIMLLDTYEKQNNDTKWTELNKIARGKFPKDKKLLDNEINYNIKMGKSEESIARLKEGITADPGNIDRYILLGQAYYQIANPEKGSKPANAKDMEKNALEQFTKVIEKDANNVYGQFFSGLIYFNQGKEINDVMIKADDNKYKELLPQRNDLINKSIGFLEKAKSITESKGVKEEDRDNYRSTLYGLMQGYNLLGKNDKADEAKKKIDALK